MAELEADLEEGEPTLLAPGDDDPPEVCVRAAGFAGAEIVRPAHDDLRAHRLHT